MTLLTGVYASISLEIRFSDKGCKDALLKGYNVAPDHTVELFPPTMDMPRSPTHYRVSHEVWALAVAVTTDYSKDKAALYIGRAGRVQGYDHCKLRSVPQCRTRIEVQHSYLPIFEYDEYPCDNKGSLNLLQILTDEKARRVKASEDRTGVYETRDRMVADAKEAVAAEHRSTNREQAQRFMGEDFKHCGPVENFWGEPAVKALMECLEDPQGDPGTIVSAGPLDQARTFMYEEEALHETRKMEAVQHEQQAAQKRDQEAILQWIDEHGSEHLKLLVEEGCEYTEMYLDERQAVDFPGWRAVPSGDVHPLRTPRLHTLVCFQKARERWLNLKMSKFHRTMGEPIDLDSELLTVTWEGRTLAITMPLLEDHYGQLLG